MAVPSDVWVMLFAAGVLGLTVALWWVELKPFINKITKLNIPNETDYWGQFKFVLRILSVLPLATPFIIDAIITVTCVSIFNLGGLSGTTLSFLLSDCISLAIVFTTIAMKRNSNEN